jgi:carboxypeptidase C (cathepsin A)
MAQDMTDLNVVAMVLISPATDYTGSAAARSNDNPYVFSLPAMAVAAWHHGKVDAGGRGLVQVFESARAFAQGEYLVALHQGALLPVAERTRMAARVAEFIGLSAATVEAADLRVDTQDFLELLLADAGKVVGRLDTRVAAVRATVPPSVDRPPAANDPALGLGKSNVVKSGIAARYFREELGLRTDRDYYGVTLDVNFKWDWSGALPSQGVGARHWFDATPKLAQLLAAKPRARLLVVSGYFDLATPLLAVRHAMSHAGLPPEQVEWLALPGSHSPYDDPDSLGVLAGRLRALAKL